MKIDKIGKDLSGTTMMVFALLTSLFFGMHTCAKHLGELTVAYNTTITSLIFLVLTVLFGGFYFFTELKEYSEYDNPELLDNSQKLEKVRRTLEIWRTLRSKDNIVTLSIGAIKELIDIISS